MELLQMNLIKLQRFATTVFLTRRSQQFNLWQSDDYGVIASRIQKERDHWKDEDVGRWTILKWILER
jgi:hypothetical protein